MTDVFLAVAHQMGVDPVSCAAIEDSHTGVQSAYSAGMAVVVMPNSAFPPGDDAIRLAKAVVGDLSELTVDLIEDLYN